MRFIFLILIFAVHFNLISQIKTANFKLNKDEEIVEILDLGKNGLLIEIVNVNDYNYHVKYFSSDLILLWEGKLPIYNPVFKTSTSDLTDYVYITNQYLQLNLKNYVIRKIDIAELPPGRVFRGYFQDERYWYALYYVKYNDTYLARRLSHDNIKYKDIYFQLPKGPQYLYSTQWYYVANDNKDIYVYNKTAGFHSLGHLKNNKFEYEIINLDSNMFNLNQIKISVDLDSIYVCPSLNFKKDHELAIPTLDFQLKTIKMKDLWVPKPEAYSSIIFDPESKNFFIYGLWSRQPFYETNNVSKANGFFIYRYDSKGNLMHKTIKKFPNDTSIYAGFEAKTLFSFNNGRLVFQVGFDNIINKLKVRAQVFTYVFFEDKLIKEYVNTMQSNLKKKSDPLTYDYVNENIQRFDFILTSHNFSGPVKFYNTLSQKQQTQNIYRIYNYKRTSIMIEEDNINQEINLFLFSN